MLLGFDVSFSTVLALCKVKTISIPVATGIGIAINPRVRATHHHPTVTGLMPTIKYFPPLFLKSYQRVIKLYYPKPLFPQMITALRGGKPGHISVSRDMPVKPRQSAGDSQTTYIPTDIFHLHSENTSPRVGCEPIQN